MKKLIILDAISKVCFILVCIFLFINSSNRIGAISQNSIKGSVWSYDKTRITYKDHCTHEHKTEEAKSIFSFFEDDRVMWLVEAPDDSYILMGIGEYYKNKGIISFNENRYQYTTTKIDRYIFEIDVAKAEMQVIKADRCDDFFPNQTSFPLKKENLEFTPSDKLVGTTWSGDIKNSHIKFEFRDKFEAALIENGEIDEVCRYVYLSDGSVIMAWGDDFGDENGYGHVNGSTLSLNAGRGFDMCSDKRLQFKLTKK